MLVAIHQPEFLPWLGFFDKLTHAEILVLLDHVQFSKSDFQNRTRIKSKNGPQWLTVPILHNFPERINEIRVVQSNWQHKHQKSLETCYSKSRYFRELAQLLDRLYGSRWERLVDLNIAALELICSFLGIEKKWILSSDLNCDGHKSDLILNICEELGAHVYYSGRRGSTYLNREHFERAKIEVRVQDFRHPVYDQQFSKPLGFVQNLSVIDLLFNCGPQSREFLFQAQVVRRRSV